MSGRLRMGLVGLAIVAGLTFSLVPDAWADYSVTAMCTTDQGGRQPCVAGWYTTPVHVDWSWNPLDGTAESGCISQSYTTDTDLTVSCVVNWSGGTTVVQPYTVQVETSTPTASMSFARPPDANGWYNHPVGVTLGDDAISGVQSCTPSAAFAYSGPDSANATIAGTCVDNAGKSASTNVSLKYDATPPTVTGVIPSRPPDFNGWYNRPVTFQFEGTDALSGIDGCDASTYSGPDTPNGSVVGSCQDRAGNVATLAVPLRYDATPPLLGVTARPSDGRVIIDARTAGSLSSFSISRTPGLDGAPSSVLDRRGSHSYRDTRVRNHVRYRYTIAARDQAGNTSVRTILVTPGPRLLAPANGSTLNAPVLLRWTSVKGASYYNVQLWRAGKILSAWPSRTRLFLRGAWVFAGKRFRLSPGRYRWYVWPGFGHRAAAHYGPMIGAGSFFVRRRS